MLIARNAQHPPLTARDFLACIRISDESQTQINLGQGRTALNHSRIAAEAIQYRLGLVRDPLIRLTSHEIETMANATVASADPAVDSAIRHIAEAWIEAGIRPELLCHPWDLPAVRTLFDANPQLIDSLDDIVRVATGSMAA